MSLDGQRNDNHDSRRSFPRSQHWVVAFAAAAILGAAGIGSLPARDLEPLTQQHSIGGELNYLLTHHAALSHLLPFAIVYLIVLALYSSASHVLSRLGPRWVDEFTDAFDAWLRTLISRFYSRYRKNLFYHLRPLDQKGIPDPGPWSLDLEQVFVDLEIEPQSISGVQANPVQRLESELRTGRHRFYDFLTPRGGEHPHLVVVGPPGSGKTTMLRYATLILLSGRRAQRKAQMPPRLRRSVPILLYLREHAVQIEEAFRSRPAGNDSTYTSPAYSLERAVNDHLSQHAPDLTVPKGWLLRQLLRGRCLVLLDGLDEIFDSAQREIVASWVQEQMNQYRTSRFVVTSRPHGYRGNTLNGVTVLGTRPFTGTQMSAFVHNWYHETEKRRHGNQDDRGVQQEARLGAENLLQRIQKLPDLYELATNPLLLTMICTVHQYKGSLPHRRVELYKDACEVLLVARQRAKGLPVILAENQAIGVLAPLAWAMMGMPEVAADGRRWPKGNVVPWIAETLARLTDMSPDEFLQYVHESGLFLELEPGEYGFAHLTFQEYLAAKHALSTNLDIELIDHIGDTWWEETIRLYCAQADSTRAITLIEACMPKGDTLPSANTLSLALACIDEAPERARVATENQVIEVIGRCVEAADSERQQIAAEVLLAKRIRDMSPLTDTSRYSPTFITCAEYQLFIDEASSRNEDRALPHWLSPHFAPGNGLKPVLGIPSEDAAAFCSWLTARVNSRGKAFRVPTVREAGTPLLQTILHESRFQGDVWVTDLTSQFSLIHASMSLDAASLPEKLELTLSEDSASAVGMPDLYARVHEPYLTRLRSDNSHIANALGNARTLAHSISQDTFFARYRPMFDDIAWHFGIVSGFSRADVLMHELIRALAQVSESSRDLTRDLDRNETAALASVLNLVIAGESALARDLNNMLKSTSMLTHELKSSIKSERVTSIVRDLDSTRNSANSLDDAILSARSTALSTAIDSASALISRPTSASVTALVSARLLDRLLDLMSALTTALALATTLITSSALKNAGTDDITTASNSALALALARARARALGLENAGDLTSTFLRARASIRAGARGLASVLADPMAALRISLLEVAAITNQDLTWFGGSQQQAHILKWRHDNSKSITTFHAFDTLMDFYAGLVTIKGRSEGWLPSTEGILLVCDLSDQTIERTKAKRRDTANLRPHGYVL